MLSFTPHFTGPGARTVKLAKAVMLAESGEFVFEGTLTTLLRDNRDDWRGIVDELRDGLSGVPEPATIGGGAAPMFYVSVVA